MRNLLKALVVVGAAVPALAFATIKDSKHDLSQGSAAAVKTTVTASPGDQICVFCHAPHKAQKQDLVWNRVAGTGAQGFATGAKTSVGNTPLPASLQPGSLACLGCHDGTIALGDVASNTVANGGSGPMAMTTVANHTDATGKLIGYAKLGAADLTGNHPVSIPYAGATYAGVTSTVVVTGNYTAITTTGCSNASGVCITATGGALPLFKSVTTDTGGLECGTCHDVHNKTNAAFFLFVPAAGSQICLACHNK